MGACASSCAEYQERQYQQLSSRRLDNEILLEQQKRNQVWNLLILGTSQSGRYTLFHQLENLFSSTPPRPLSASTSHIYASNIHQEILIAMRCLCSKVRQEEILKENWESVLFFRELKESDRISPILATQIARLWQDPAIQEQYRGYEYTLQLKDSVRYYLDKITEIGTDGYTPSKEDILRTRTRITGVRELKLTVNANPWNVIDISGVNTGDRRKFMHQFDRVSALIFVVDLSSYALVEYDFDIPVPWMSQSMSLFEEVVNSRHFRRAEIILLLNKRDLFVEKLRTVPLTRSFPDYRGENSYESAVTYIAQQFAALNRDPCRQIFDFPVSVVDEKNMQFVFNAISEMLVRQSLRHTGL